MLDDVGQSAVCSLRFAINKQLILGGKRSVVWLTWGVTAEASTLNVKLQSQSFRLSIPLGCCVVVAASPTGNLSFLLHNRAQHSLDSIQLFKKMIVLIFVTLCCWSWNKKDNLQAYQTEKKWEVKRGEWGIRGRCKMSAGLIDAFLEIKRCEHSNETNQEIFDHPGDTQLGLSNLCWKPKEY